MALSSCEKFVLLLRGITSNHNGDFCCLNCFHSYSTKEKLEKHENTCNDHDNCYVEMPNDSKILKYNHEEKSLKAPFIIYDWKKCTHVKIILKNLIQKKKLSICLTKVEIRCTYFQNVNSFQVNYPITVVLTSTCAGWYNL